MLMMIFFQNKTLEMFNVVILLDLLLMIKIYTIEFLRECQKRSAE